jgi:DNA-binding LacI/PurR family transcriptional regulator
MFIRLTPLKDCVSRVAEDDLHAMRSAPSAQRHITQRDIAKALGISNATVSLALRNSEALTLERREEVQAAAQRMGYRPNPAATELSRYKRDSIIMPNQSAVAWINAWQPAEKLRSYKQFDCYWNGAEEAARKLGYHLEEFRLDTKLTTDRLQRILESRGIRGILLPPQDPHPEWKGFPWEKFSVVRFGRSLRTPATHVVSSDHVANAMLAFSRMREKGYKRIGFITNEDAHAKKGGHLSEAGFLMAQRLVPVRERIPICVIGELPNTGRAAKVASWVKRNRIDAILTEVAQTPSILSKSGLRVPRDVGLASVNTMDINISAGIHQNPEEIGRVGLLMLHSLITDGARGIPQVSRQVLVEGNWVDGASLPARIAAVTQVPS